MDYHFEEPDLNLVTTNTKYPPLVLNPPLNVTFVTDATELELVSNFLARSGSVFGWDIETDVKDDYYWRKCRTIQVGNQQEQYVVDLLAFCDYDSDILFNEQGEYGKNINKLKPVLDVFIPYLTNYECKKVGVNLAFEYITFYWNFGIRTLGFYDCSVVERCIYAGLHSLKDYGFFSMDEMVNRYFNYSVDKTLQTSFDLVTPLTQEQVHYAALDTRLPISLKAYQDIIISGKYHNNFRKVGLDPRILGDNLEEICQIENDAVGVFQDMHVHGELLDTDKWTNNVNKSKAELEELIKNELDPVFLPWVGSKYNTYSDEEINKAEQLWKSYNIPTDEELELKAKIREHKKLKIPYDALEKALLEKELLRKSQKEPLKELCSNMKKQRTKLKNLADKCEGEALVNYGSDAQLRDILKEHIPSLANLDNMKDITLEEYEKTIPVMGAIRKYHGLSKSIGTYGDQWAMQWKTHPCKEEGWLHPGDGRLHCRFNQYDAATGRSSSSQPNAQNLPQDTNVRSCFVADPPNEIFPDGYELLTIDMSGAELRILAEEAHDPIWIEAFSKDQDVHSVCTELINDILWKVYTVEECSFYKKSENGEFAKKKCKCPEHNKLRNAMKPTNFGIPYGIGPEKLSVQINKSLLETKKLLDKHRELFPYIWDYIDESGAKALETLKSFDMFGRRRIFPDPNDRAAQIKKAIQKGKDKKDENPLLLPEDRQKANIEAFYKAFNEDIPLIDEELYELTGKKVNTGASYKEFNRKPTEEELYELTHRAPNSKELNSAKWSLRGSVERQGKNHRIQSCNATIIKLAMGCGFDKNGVAYLWHTLPLYGAKILKMVHDELVILVPKLHSEKVAQLVQDAFRRAAATKMKYVIMESEYNLGPCWKK